MKINGDIIKGIKINGSEILIGKINGSIVFSKNAEGQIQIIINGKEITVNGNNSGQFKLCYGNSYGEMSDYEPISLLSFTGGKWTYSYLNELNVAPPDATELQVLLGTDKLGSVELTKEFLFDIDACGNKMYSVGLLSDVHVDGNGDGNNSDSGDSQTDFINALQFFNTKNANFVCIDGDVTYYGYDADYQAYNNIVNNYSNGIPVKAIRGNHECYANGESNGDYTNTKFQDNIAPLYYEYKQNNDIYLFCGMDKESKSDPFSQDELSWLVNKLEEHKDKRVFLFVHYYIGPVGNVNGISSHGAITNTTFINLITQYKNIIYFSGHTHLAFKLQMYGSTANIDEQNDICNRVHIPSCAKPRTSMSGLGGSAEIYAEGSEGYFMDVYEKGLLLKGINFETNKYLPIATYWLPTITSSIKDTSNLIPGFTGPNSTTSGGISYNFVEGTNKLTLNGTSSSSEHIYSNSFKMNLEVGKTYAYKFNIVSGTIDASAHEDSYYDKNLLGIDSSGASTKIATTDDVTTGTHLQQFTVTQNYEYYQIDVKCKSRDIYSNVEIEIEVFEFVDDGVLGSQWFDYNTPNFDGPSRATEGLDVWMYNLSSGTINGVYLDVKPTKTVTFTLNADYYSYAGAPVKYCVFVLDVNNNDAIVNRFDYTFDANGTLVNRDTTVQLAQGNYKVVIGSDSRFEFGVKVHSVTIS